MRRECRERSPRHWIQMKPLISYPGMHHGTCVTHVPWCMSGSLTSGSGGNVPGIPGACVTHKFTYLVRGPLIGCHHQADVLSRTTSNYDASINICTYDSLYFNPITNYGFDWFSEVEVRIVCDCVVSTYINCMISIDLSPTVYNLRRRNSCFHIYYVYS